jgi:predicted RNA-binding protein Jag
VTGISTERREPAAAVVGEDEERFALRIEIDATYDSLGEHGRALASLLLAIHEWLDDQEAASVDVTIDGRRFTLHARERE